MPPSSRSLPAREPALTRASARPNAAALRSRPRTGIRLAFHAALLGALVTACGGKAAPASDTIAIGVGAIPGRPGYDAVLQGLDLAVARLNEAGTVTFRIRRPDARAVSAVRIAEQLRDDPSVLGVVGHPESGNTLEAVPVYADIEHDGADAVVAVSPTASSPRLSGISPWFFRVAPSDNDAARFVAQWVRDTLRASRAAIIYRNDAYGREWSSTFSEAFAKGTATVIDREPYLNGIMEWDAYARLLAIQRPDVLLFPGDAVDAIALLRALEAINVRIPFVGGDGTEGMQSAPEARGARFVAFFRPERATSAEGKLFLTRYREKYHAEPDMFAALSYDAALAIGRAVLAGARTRAGVKDALEQLGHGVPPVQGAAGPIAFERDHDISGRTVVVTTIGSGK